MKIPEELKPWLVDDWDLITRQKHLFYLSARKNVDSILQDYANYKKSCGNTDNEYAVNEVVAGIEEYFNVMLGTQLLYKFDRPQYAEILADHPHALMSKVYGAPHLLMYKLEQCWPIHLWMRRALCFLCFFFFF